MGKKLCGDAAFGDFQGNIQSKAPRPRKLFCGPSLGLDWNDVGPQQREEGRSLFFLNPVFAVIPCSNVTCPHDR